MKYFDVYFLCQSASRLLDGGFERTINDFFEPLSESGSEKNSFNKYSILHEYCEWVIRANIWDEKNSAVSIKKRYRNRGYSRNDGTLWVDIALNHYSKKKYDFLDWVNEETGKTVDCFEDAEIDELQHNYLISLSGLEEFDDFVARLSSEMFYVLFQNRGFLYNFNQYLSTYNQIRKPRISIPKWAQRAILFRDRGRCVFCSKDLSGTINITEDREVHYDHIVSLGNNGMNDISNLQPSCQKCNLKKSKGSKTSTYYQQWYKLK